MAETQTFEFFPQSLRSFFRAVQNVSKLGKDRKRRLFKSLAVDFWPAGLGASSFEKQPSLHILDLWGFTLGWFDSEPCS